MKIDELIALGGAAPPITNAAPVREMIEEITKIYFEIYVPGLSQFFESQWYNFRGNGLNPVTILVHSRPLTCMFADILGVLKEADSSDAGQAAETTNLETHLVWALATLAYAVPPGINAPRSDLLPADDGVEACNRLRVFETLLAGDSSSINPLLPPLDPFDLDYTTEFDFWYTLGEYLRLPTHEERQESLFKLRTLLDGRENRDVLYSMAVLREYSGRFEPGYEVNMPSQLDEAEPRHKLHVASKFIKAEAANATGGMTNVVRRFALLAIKAFINPGVNVVRGLT